MTKITIHGDSTIEIEAGKVTITGNCVMGDSNSKSYTDTPRYGKLDGIDGVYYRGTKFEIIKFLEIYNPLSEEKEYFMTLRSA